MTDDERERMQHLQAIKDRIRDLLRRPAAFALLGEPKPGDVGEVVEYEAPREDA